MAAAHGRGTASEAQVDVLYRQIGQMARVGGRNRFAPNRGAAYRQKERLIQLPDT
jgi:hypothetical protein